MHTHAQTCTHMCTHMHTIVTKIKEKTPTNVADSKGRVPERVLIDSREGENDKMML